MLEKVTSTHEDQPVSPVRADWSVLEKLAGKYDDRERKRIDRKKDELRQAQTVGVMQEFEREKIDVPPSLVRKIGRLAIDATGLTPKISEERRDREAMSVALREYHEEREDKKRLWDQESQRIREEQALLDQKIAAEKEQREREALERDMAHARDRLEQHRNSKLHNERAQEIVERDLNNRLLKADMLEEEVLSENPEVGNRMVQFGDTEVPVFDLRGIPYSMLTHTVDYRQILLNGSSSVFGTETFQKLLENPSVWTERKDEAEQDTGFGTSGKNARGDVISASYTNSESNINSRYRNRDGYVNLVYGFDHVDGDSIISISNGDGGTTNTAGKSETFITSPDEIKNLEGPHGTSNYNEILLRRYSDNGIPKKPDYIVAENGEITETMLRHASYFGIPIVNIETGIYEEKQEKHGLEILDSISEDDSYEELDGKVAELSSIDKFKHYYDDSVGIGRGVDITKALPSASAIEEKCIDVEKLEMKKRIDFIEDTLKKLISNIKEATEAGKAAPRKPSNFESFQVTLMDAKNYSGRSILGNEGHMGSFGCNTLIVNFKLSNSTREVKTNIYDGEHYVEEPLNIETYENGADSSFYERITPLAEEYFDAYQENQKLIPH